MSADVITVSSKGQIVLPSKVRNSLSIQTGDRFAVYVYEDTIMLKPLRLPSESEIEKEFKDAQEWAKSVGLTEEDVNDAIKTVRARKRAAK